MATKRAPAAAPAEQLPTTAEITDAIERWRVADHLAKVARDEETERRRALVDVLHRAGLKGFTL